MYICNQHFWKWPLLSHREWQNNLTWKYLLAHMVETSVDSWGGDARRLVLFPCYLKLWCLPLLMGHKSSSFWARVQEFSEISWPGPSFHRRRAWSSERQRATPIVATARARTEILTAILLSNHPVEYPLSWVLTLLSIHSADIPLSWVLTPVGTSFDEDFECHHLSSPSLKCPITWIVIVAHFVDRERGGIK